ncbi:MAG: YetF domain-containing protein [Nodosilinea sp.]
MDYSLAKDLFGSWNAVLHTLIVGTLSYIGLIGLLRVSGKRTLSKWNAFDFVVTIAFGSILASALLTGSTSFVQAMLAIGLLVGLQYLLTWLSVRTDQVQSLVKAEPTLLLFEGSMLESTLKKERVAKGEVLAAIRLSGHSRVEDIGAVVLETDGSFSVIAEVDPHRASALKDVEGFADKPRRIA